MKQRKKSERDWIRRKNRLYQLIRRSLQIAAVCSDHMPGVPGLRRPLANISARSLFADFIDDEDIDIYDYVEEGYPWQFRSKELISMCWDQSRVSGCQSYSALKLNAQTSLYFEQTENQQDHLYLIAVSRSSSPQDAHKRFLRALLISNGGSFDTGIMGSPPTSISCAYSQKFLAECMLQVAEFMGYADFREGVWEIQSYMHDAVSLPEVDDDTSQGRRRFIEAYVAGVKSRPYRRPSMSRSTKPHKRRA